MSEEIEPNRLRVHNAKMASYFRIVLVIVTSQILIFRFSGSHSDRNTNMLETIDHGGLGYSNTIDKHVW